MLDTQVDSPENLITTVISQLPCWSCGEYYEPSQESLKAWAESGHDYDPTDWQCPKCYERDALPEMGDLE